jgi:hypothetical protein
MRHLIFSPSPFLRLEGLASDISHLLFSSDDTEIAATDDGKKEAVVHTNAHQEAAVLLSTLALLAEPYGAGPANSPPVDLEISNEVEVISRGNDCKTFSTIRVRGHVYGLGSEEDLDVHVLKATNQKSGRGYNLVVLDSQYCVIDVRNFDNVEDISASERMADFIDNIPKNRVVLVTTNSGAATTITKRALKALLTVGAKDIEKLSPDGSFVLIGRKGAHWKNVVQSSSPVASDIVVVRQQLPSIRIPLKIECTGETIHSLIQSAIDRHSKLNSLPNTQTNTSPPTDWSIRVMIKIRGYGQVSLLSLLQLLAVNIYQLMRGTSIEQALLTVSQQDRNALKLLLLTLISGSGGPHSNPTPNLSLNQSSPKSSSSHDKPSENASEVECLDESISEAALTLFVLAFKLLHPIATERQQLLITYIEEFNELEASGEGLKNSNNKIRSRLEMLLHQLADTKILADFFHINITNTLRDEVDSKAINQMKSGETGAGKLLSSVTSLYVRELRKTLEFCVEDQTKERDKNWSSSLESNAIDLSGTTLIVMDSLIKLALSKAAQAVIVASQENEIPSLPLSLLSGTSRAEDDDSVCSGIFDILSLLASTCADILNAVLQSNTIIKGYKPNSNHDSDPSSSPFSNSSTTKESLTLSPDMEDILMRSPLGALFPAALFYLRMLLKVPLNTFLEPLNLSLVINY